MKFGNQTRWDGKEDLDSWLERERKAREGLLAAAAALNPHAPAMKEVVKGIEAAGGVLGKKENK